MVNFIRYLMLGSIVFFIGCDLKHESKDVLPQQGMTQTSGSFYDFKKELIVEPLRYATYGTTTEKLLKFKVCLKDYAHNKEIIGHKFLVSEGQKLIKEDLATQGDGCINWQEEMTPNPVSQPKYLMIERIIKSTGVHRGFHKVTWAVNPWVEQDDPDKKRAVVDPDNGETIPTDTLYGKDALLHLQGSGYYSLALKKENRPKVWFDTIDYEMVDLGPLADNKWKSKLTVKISPKILYRRYDDSEVSRPVTTGKFIIQPMLFARGENGDLKEVAELSRSADEEDIQQWEVPVEVKGGKIAKSFIFIQKEVLDKGTYELGLKVIPVDSPNGLRQFEGAFNIGHFDELVSSRGLNVQSQFFKPWSEYNLSHYTKKLSDKIDGARAATWRFKPVFIRYYGVDTATELNTERTIYVRAQVCVNHPTRRAYINGKHFKLYRIKMPWESEPTVAQPTVVDGCINWVDRVWHSWYDLQGPRRYEVVFEDEAKNKTVIPMGINPWAMGWSMGMDYRVVSEITEPNQVIPNACGSEEMTDCSQLKPAYSYMDRRLIPSEDRDDTMGFEQGPEIFIKSFSLNRVGHTHVVNDELTMNILFKYRLVLTPRIRRLDDFEIGRKGSENLRDGLYLLRLVILADPSVKKAYNLESRVLMASQNVVKVRDGIVITDIEMLARDQVALNFRSSVYFQILPLDERKVYTDERFLAALGFKYNDPEKIAKIRRFYGMDVSPEHIYGESDTVSLMGERPSRIDSPEATSEAVRDFGLDIFKGYIEEFHKKTNQKNIDYMLAEELENFEKQFYVRLHNNNFISNIDDFIEKSGWVYKSKPGTGVYKNILLKPHVFHARTTLEQKKMTGDLLLEKHGENNHESMGQIWGQEKYIDQDGTTEISSQFLAHLLEKEKEKYYKNLGFDPENGEKSIMTTDQKIQKARDQAKKLLASYVEGGHYSYFEMGKNAKDIFGNYKGDGFTFFDRAGYSDKKVEEILDADSFGFVEEVGPYYSKGYQNFQKLATDLCLYMYSENFDKHFKAGSRKPIISISADYKNNELDEVGAKFFDAQPIEPIERDCILNPLGMITVDKNLYVHRVDQKGVKLIEGFRQNFNVNTNFLMGLSAYDSVYRSHSSMVSGQLGIKGGIEFGMPRPSNASGAGPKVFGFNGGSLNSGLELGYGQNFSSTRSKAGEIVKSDKLNFTNGLYLVVLNSRIEVPVLEYQNCIRVGYNIPGLLGMLGKEDLVEKYILAIQPEKRNENGQLKYFFKHSIVDIFKQTRLKNILTEQARDAEMLDLLTSGLMICSEPTERTEIDPKKIVEDYYMLSQHFTGNEAQIDSLDYRNNPWLLTMRGQGDFKKLMQLFFKGDPEANDPCHTHLLQKDEAVVNLVKNAYTNRPYSIKRMFQYLPRRDFKQYLVTYDDFSVRDIAKGINPFSFMSWGAQLEDYLSIKCTSQAPEPLLWNSSSDN